MKTFVEYSKAVGSLAFGLMIWIGAVMIAVPGTLEEKLPSMLAQSIDQSDISVVLELDESNPPQLFSWTSIRYDLEITNSVVQWLGESYPEVEVSIILSDGLSFESLSQDVVVLYSTPTQQWNTVTFTYRDPFQAWETNTFGFDVLATDIWTQTVSVEVVDLTTANESNPYVPGCGSPSNNVVCSTLAIEDNLEPSCSPELWSQSLYEDWELNDDSFRALPACEVWSFWTPFPSPADTSAPDSEFTFNCVLVGKAPVSCNVERRFCGDTIVDIDQNEACDTLDVDGLSCDPVTCQLIWCMNEQAYNHDTSATQDNWECRAMGDGSIDFSDGELCDDGNTTSWDGCTQAWEIESGYTCALAWQPCEDINECELSAICGSNSLCENTPWSFSCSCESGYDSTDGANCTDVDECALSTDSCDENASCSNTEGGFSCACEAWFEWDGETCADIDECATWADLCDDTWVCSNTVWWYSCSCAAWYFNQMNSDWSAAVNTCLEVDECTGQVDDQNGWYQTIQESPSLNQWDECTSLWGICSNEVWWTPWYSCDCPVWYLADGQWLCQVVYGDTIVVEWIEQCDTWVLWVDDGCDDIGQYEIPVCDISISPTTWSIGTMHQLSLANTLAPRTSLVLVERWDGSVLENPTLPESHTYTAGQQYTITATVENTLNSSILSTCETVVAIDTVCGNEIQEPWELCDMWLMNDVMCSTEYGETCEYCTSSCTLETISWASCGDGMVDETQEACDDGQSNGQLCNGIPWTVCEYCSTNCELTEYTVPLSSKWWSSSSISVSVKKTASWIETEKMHSTAWDEEKTDGIDNESMKPSTPNDTAFVDSIVDSLVTDWTSAMVWEWNWAIKTTITPISLDEIFMQPVPTLTPESLSEILYTINTSSKDQLREALQRYLDMKEG